MFWIRYNNAWLQPDCSGDTGRVALLSSQKHGWMISPWIRMWYWMVLNSWERTGGSIRPFYLPREFSRHCHYHVHPRRLLMLPLLASFYSLLNHSCRHPTPKHSFSFLGSLTTPPCLPLSPHSPNMSTVTQETIEFWTVLTVLIGKYCTVLTGKM